MNNTITSNTELTKAIFIYCPPGHEQYYRPFDSNINNRNMEHLLSMIDHSQPISPTSISASAASILAPSVTPKDIVHIDGGMREGRYAFYLEVTTHDVFGTEREILSGFTNHAGINPVSGSIDPNMRLHLNSRKVIKDYETTGPSGTIVKPIIRLAQNVLSEIHQHPQAISMRPEDVATHGQRSLLQQNKARTFDVRSLLAGQAKLADNRYAIPSYYISEVCNAYVNADNDARGDFTKSDIDIHSMALDYTRNPTIQQSNFWNSFGNRAAVETSHTFLFGELAAIWPRPNDWYIKIMPRPGNHLSTPLDNSEHWHGADITTSIACSLTHILPALMSRLMLTKVEVVMSNKTADASHHIAVLNFTGMFDNVITPEHIRHLETQLEMEVIRGLLLSQVGTFDIRMNLNLLTMSTFNISINDNPHIPYCAPMFCDSHYSPLIGLDDSNLTKINNGVETLVATMLHRSSNPWDAPPANYSDNYTPWDKFEVIPGSISIPIQPAAEPMNMKHPHNTLPTLPNKAHSSALPHKRITD